ncbi:CaiB/BaiF CoA transferase family protein [Noviherbaspirillum sp.]|uniref:CaiB/BaiF CoA transferase family protein n=1 Tax=Noviherbaspirillum sp. TaxID=1926288 RepID=UPI0039C94B6E
MKEDMRSEGTGATGALDGLKVLDFTQMLAGPFCTQLLADQGAEVIKIEPMAGDTTRKVGPFHPDDKLRAFGGYFQSANRNKLSLVLDLKKAEAREIVLKLAEQADVVVENYRPGVMDRFGLSYEVLRERNPKLVYASIRGFGDPRTGSSPYMEWPAFDVVSQAMGGLMGITGPDENTPIKVGPGMGDLVPAVLAAYGVMAAVFRAQRCGRGQFLNVAMVDGVLALCERTIYQYSYQGKVAHPEGNQHPLLCPFGMFPARDGWVTLACQSDDFWRQLCMLIEREDMLSDARFTDNQTRVQNRDAVYEAVSGYTTRYTKRELTERLGGHVPFGPVYDIADIHADPHFRQSGMLAEVEQPGMDRKLAIAGIPIHMSETPGSIRHRAPLLGEHSDMILREAGCSAAEIARWREAGAVA